MSSSVSHFKLPSQNLNMNSTTSSWTTFQLLLVAFVSCFIVWYVQFIWRRRTWYKHAGKLSGPFSLPLIGSAWHFARESYDILNTLAKLFATYPSVFRIWFGPRLFLCVSVPKYIEILLQKCLKKEPLYRFTEIVMGQGLLSARDVKKWKKHRKLILPSFNQTILNRFVVVFTEKAEILLEQFKQFSGKGEIDLFHTFSQCTLDTICETAMGVTVNAQTTNAPFSKWLDQIMETTFVRIFVIWYHSDFIFNMTSLSKTLNEYARNVKNFTSKVVRDKTEAFTLKNQQIRDNTFKEEGRQRKAFLDYLIETTNEEGTLTEQELSEQVNTFIIAGSDTTATTLGFCLLTLALYPDVQEKVYQEVMDVLGSDRKPEPSDLPNMKYLDLFIKETLRFFPVAPFIVRYIEEDVHIDDYVFPKGASVCFCILQLHRDEKYWPEPLKFIPERFLPEEVAKRHPCVYIPFSHGPRNCIGQKYATMAVKTIISTIVRKFKMSTSYKSIEEVDLKCNVVLRPKDGYKVSVQLR